MNATLLLDRTARRLSRADGRVYEPARRKWIDSSGDAQGEPIAAVAAARWLALEAGVSWRVPVGIVGPRDIDEARYEIARRVAAGVAGMRVPVLCGGRGGVMEAACRGAWEAAGTAIALLPEPNPGLANAYASIVIATGIGEARNALIARASLCLVAIGDSFGTLSEVALGRQFGKHVIGLGGAANVAGVEHMVDADDALERVAQVLLAL